MTFTVTVFGCVETHLGNGAALVGHTDSIPVRLLSAVAMTNLAFTVVYPFERLTNFTFTVHSPQVVTQAVACPEAGEARIEFTVRAAGALQGPVALGDLGFTVSTNQSSAFVALELRDVIGLTADGRTVANATGLPGRLVVIGRQPLLEAGPHTNGNRKLTLYGNRFSIERVLVSPDGLAQVGRSRDQVVGGDLDAGDE